MSPGAMKHFLKWSGGGRAGGSSLTNKTCQLKLCLFICYVYLKEMFLLLKKGKVIPLQARCGPEGG